MKNSGVSNSRKKFANPKRSRKTFFWGNWYCYFRTFTCVIIQNTLVHADICVWKCPRKKKNSVVSNSRKTFENTKRTQKSFFEDIDTAIYGCFLVSSSKIHKFIPTQVSGRVLEKKKNSVVSNSRKKIENRNGPKNLFLRTFILQFSNNFLCNQQNYMSSCQYKSLEES